MPSDTSNDLLQRGFAFAPSAAVAVLAVGALCVHVVRLRRRKRRELFSGPGSSQSDVVLLLQSRPMPYVTSSSPFTLKMETYLRMAGIPYEVDKSPELQIMAKSPTQKIPCIVYHGQVIPDSSRIIDFLRAEFGVFLDADLTAEEQAITTLVQRTLEGSLYFVALYYRWIEDAGFAYVLKNYLTDMPGLVKRFLFMHIRKAVSAQAFAQGISRYPPEYVATISERDVAAVAQMYGNDPNKVFFFGHDKPTSIDATVFGFVAGIVFIEFDNPTRQHFLHHPNLVRYAKRLMERYYPTLAQKAFSLLPSSSEY
mmetsp:Transcript_23775/g.40920  ORF Transcript_23775/g.40920 Transcript_23775/m.40920 type:complete len:311 (+) Transcript_23775:64-996(+)|eukprot:CAMPEP_0196660084 /NCGR_PEP_ID=MMETSP1086-20130531/38030_1 /TAXON_ID=77921 /ORGANISM="Cyanoptyche  gloeocystis , Strain SAG4.97" /LENGTH=310 /DNA_ID=CAMNT_0041994331 /DNA_START=47 /DNA_END=979 /DNA_ORIENTATION=-